MTRRIALVCLFLALIAGCKSRVKKVSADDARMNAAIEKARSSVNTFITALQAPKKGQEDFAIKIPFTQGRHTEHMWVSDVTYDGAKFHGTLTNEPEMVRNVRYGQRVSALSSQISDWMYVDKGTLVGGYTIRVLRDGMSARERAAFDRSLPYRID